MKATRYIIAATAVTALLFTQCKDKNGKEDEDFKKEEILANLADNTIIPGYNDLQADLNALNASWTAFAAAPDQAGLDEVRTHWQAANVSFHKVKMYEIGPAMTANLNLALGTFPADTAQIESNVANGGYDLSSNANSDAVGFESLDFLLYGHDALNKLTGSAMRRAYVQDVIAKMSGEVTQVVNGWTTYRATFVAGTGTSSTSAFSLLVNNFCRDFELAKAAKLGIPIGTQSLGIQQPLYLEARRSGFGKTLLATNIKALHDLFLGRSLAGVNGKGYDDYLIALEKSTLSATIDARFASMDTAPSAWTGSIENMMAASPSTLTDFYNYMQGTVVYIKTDMASAFGVLITYQDGDGD